MLRGWDSKEKNESQIWWRRPMAAATLEAETVQGQFRAILMCLVRSYL